MILLLFLVTEVSLHDGSTGAIRINQNGGVYHCGKLYDDSKKLQVALSYMELVENEGQASCRWLGEVASVGKSYASQIIREVREGRVVVGHMREPRNSIQGIGSKTLDAADEQVLLSVYYGNPSHYW